MRQEMAREARTFTAASGFGDLMQAAAVGVNVYQRTGLPGSGAAATTRPADEGPARDDFSLAWV